MYYISKTVSWDGFHEETVLRTFVSGSDASEYMKMLFAQKVKKDGKNTVVSFNEERQVLVFKEPCRKIKIRVKIIDETF